MRRVWFLAGALGLASSAAAAETFVFAAVERGTFRADGSHELGSEAEYVVGRGAQGEMRAVLVFDLDTLRAPVTSALLRVWSPADGVESPDAGERVGAYGVSSDPQRLVWEPSVDSVLALEPALGTFWDLGTGRRLGVGQVRAGEVGFVEIPLDSAWLRVLNRSDGLVALGLAVDSLRKPPFDSAPVRELAFENSGAGVPHAELVLETDATVDPGGPLTLHVDARARRHGRGSEADPFRTLAGAIDLATAGDDVEVAPGRYAETLIMKRDVDVRGSGADRTIIDIGAGLPSMRCADASLDSIYVNGDPRASQVVDCTNGTSPTLANVELPTIFLENSRAIVRNSETGSI